MKSKFNLVNNEKGWFITEENETEEQKNAKSYSRIEEVFQRLNEQANEIENLYNAMKLACEWCGDHCESCFSCPAEDICEDRSTDSCGEQFLKYFIQKAKGEN